MIIIFKDLHLLFKDLDSLYQTLFYKNKKYARNLKIIILLSIHFNRLKTKGDEKLNK